VVERLRRRRRVAEAAPVVRDHRRREPRGHLAPAPAIGDARVQHHDRHALPAPLLAHERGVSTGHLEALTGHARILGGND
jgi:hypothetical protein